MPNFMTSLPWAGLFFVSVFAAHVESSPGAIPPDGKVDSNRPVQTALIQINAVARIFSTVHGGNGPDAVRVPIFETMRSSMSAAGDDRYGRPRRRRMEIFAFLFLTAVLMPAMAFAVVGSYGLAVWVYQLAAGPPGPPAH
jgi:nitrate reductase NapE